MSLPSRALDLIHDYSRPLTRPEWRKSKPIITTYKLYCVFRRRERFGKLKMKNIILLENIEHTNWYWTYKIIQNYGIERYYQKHFFEFGAEYEPINVLAMDGVSEAIRKHRFYYNDWE
jgi:hypothetical protein